MRYLTLWERGRQEGAREVVVAPCEGEQDVTARR